MDTKSILSSILWGGGFIALGILWLLDSLNVITFNIGDWWPLIFVFIGVSIIIDGVFGGKKK